MKPVARVSITFVVLIATFYFVLWLPCSLLPLRNDRSIAVALSLACAVAAAGFVWVASASVSRGLVTSVLWGAIVTGGIGFAAGFFGPILLTPEANQGPLLGIFFTGPIGAVLGAFGGMVWWYAHRQRTPR